jgi:hypothetical protein
MNCDLLNEPRRRTPSKSSKWIVAWLALWMMPPTDNMALSTPTLTPGVTYVADPHEAWALHAATHDEAANTIRTNALARGAKTNSYLLHSDPDTGEVIVENLGTGGRNARNDGKMKAKAHQITVKQRIANRLRQKLRDRGVAVPNAVVWAGVKSGV